MLHQTVNCILVIALIVLVIVCWKQPAASGGDGTEGFFNYTLANAAPFHATSTPPYDTSVFSSYPPQREENSSWTFTTPFQSTCTSMSSKDGASSCAPCNKFTCYLTPHNQRKCSWGTSQ